MDRRCLQDTTTVIDIYPRIAARIIYGRDAREGGRYSEDRLVATNVSSFT